ncbi:MAG: dihydroorotate dehydrogenase, partial [Planctomycetes bacterium]|nr:dihydroorotate dehydrogenase [Planctomycetota bacterium]
GLTRVDLMRINEKLLDFMQHDRVTVAGTMFGLGILYVALSWNGSRRGWHWAHVACVASAFVGCFSFFLFLGFGYFDPFHAFVTAILFQFLIMALHSDLPPVTNRTLPELTNDAAWRRSQWGQFFLVIHGAALIVAGATISCFGITSVFVPEDLQFMETSYETICTTDPLLLPLVAHDRATFGGMTLATGVTILLCALWGFRRGNRWLWNALMISGTICYLTTLWVHWKVGYTIWTHLVPVYIGLSLLWLTGGLSHGHLCAVKYADE